MTHSICCVVPGCRKIRFARGLCRRCWDIGNREDKSGVMSWAERERKGLALPSQAMANKLRWNQRAVK